MLVADVDRLVILKALLQKADWSPCPPEVTPLPPADAERRKVELQVCYMQHRMQRERGEPC
jgi:hypothetical protein